MYTSLGDDWMLKNKRTKLKLKIVYDAFNVVMSVVFGYILYSNSMNVLSNALLASDNNVSLYTL